MFIADKSFQKAESELLSIGEDMDDPDARQIVLIRTLLQILDALKGIRSAIVHVGARD